MDFTEHKYRQLLKLLLSKKYNFQTFDEFLRIPNKKSIILRHDVDLRPENSLTFAKLQNELGVKGVYYFRAVPESWDEQIIRQIAELGHEIGYHYECLTTCKGNLAMAIQDFEKNLTELRRLAPVATICMHGSPLSKYDSKDLWKTHSYRDFGIIGEPYFDIDFNKVAYLTDTGRRWDGEKVSVRDKVSTTFTHSFKTTDDIITAAKQPGFPNQIMFTFHPQRWNDNPYFWTQELVTQNVKNIIKRYFFVRD
ncbi:hypothetical protein [Larkinella punicea]|uniref:Polysaccharide deacetylase n=1 Tax=Larkinella punicea TaxID=2315727 RepID=A0A368JIX6_9BACT|nr:hypothetical protein [Larkinella punicea]RCR67607.1 hypothetical protein DUE52_21120 [Larkinella punicea]